MINEFECTWAAKIQIVKVEGIKEATKWIVDCFSIDAYFSCFTDLLGEKWLSEIQTDNLWTVGESSSHTWIGKKPIRIIEGVYNRCVGFSKKELCTCMYKVSGHFLRIFSIIKHLHSSKLWLLRKQWRRLCVECFADHAMLRWLWCRATDDFLDDFFAGKDAAREFEYVVVRV